MKKKSGYNPQAPPRFSRSTPTTTPRPYAPQPVPQDYKGEPLPKMPQKDVMSIAKREGEVLKAHGVTQNATRQELLTAKRTIQQQTTPTPPKTHPPTAQAQKAPAVAEAPKYNFSEKAKAAFAKLNPKKKEPKKEQQKEKEPEKKEQQPKKRVNER